MKAASCPDGSQWAPKFWKFRVAPYTALRTSRVCRAQANPRGYGITPILAFPMPYMAGFVLPALASSALGTATPAASTGSRGCVCRRRLGRDRGLGSQEFLTSGLVCRNLEHAGHTGSMALPCQAWTAVRRMLRDAGAVGTVASYPQPYWWWALLVQHAFIQALTIPQRKQALTNCSRPPGRCNSSCS